MNRVEVLRSQQQDDPYVQVERRGVIGVLVLHQSAPRTARHAVLTQEMRFAVLRGLRALQAEATCRCIVITSDSERAFSVGLHPLDFADALVQDEARDIPSLATLCAEVEKSEKVVVAAISGLCSSWGLSLALAAHYRVCTPTSRWCFPEVQLSLVPCGGGSQRLTRVVGVQSALSMLCTGRPVPAQEAKQMKLVDHVLAAPTSTPFSMDTLVDQAAVFAMQQCGLLVATPARSGQELVFAPKSKELKLRRSSENRWLGLQSVCRGEIAWVEHQAREITPRFVQAPFKAIAAVRIAVQHARNFAKALAAETELFKTCLSLPEAKSMQHVLRIAHDNTAPWKRPVSSSHSSVDDISGGAVPPLLRNVAVIGAGTMGVSVAAWLVQEQPGMNVVLVEINVDRQQVVRAEMEAYWQRSVNAEVMTMAQKTDCLSRLRVMGSHYDPFPSILADCDLVIECVPESLPLKQNVFSHLDQLCKRACIFATCSCTVDVNVLAAVTQRPEKVIGFHVFPPANENRLVELVRGAATDVAVLRRLLSFLEQHGKQVVITRSCTGYASIRLLLSGLYQLSYMLEEGNFPFEMDRALKKSGCLRIGLFEQCDVIGLDVLRMARKALPANVRLLPPRAVFDVMDGLVKDGRLGRKTGAGWYKYRYSREATPRRSVLYRLLMGKGPAVPQGPQHHTLLSLQDMVTEHDWSVEHRVLANGREKKIIRRYIKDSEVVERVLFAMLNEAAQLLVEGIVDSAGDVDCLSVFGFAFAAWKGGLCHYADNQVTIPYMVSRMRIYHAALPDTFPAPCQVLLEMEKTGSGFEKMFPTPSA